MKKELPLSLYLVHPNASMACRRRSDRPWRLG